MHSLWAFVTDGNSQRLPKATDSPMPRTCRLGCAYRECERVYRMDAVTLPTRNCELRGRAFHERFIHMYIIHIIYFVKNPKCAMPYKCGLVAWQVLNDTMNECMHVRIICPWFWSVVHRDLVKYSTGQVQRKPYCVAFSEMHHWPRSKKTILSGFYDGNVNFSQSLDANVFSITASMWPVHVSFAEYSEHWQPVIVLFLVYA